MPARAGGAVVDAVESFGTFGAILVDGFGERVGLALELRARELMGQLRRHNPESAAHSIRVAGITMGMWRAAPGLLGSVETALLGSLLHDVGKLHVPRGILASTRLLVREEPAVMAAHASVGAEMLLALGFPESIAAIARGHHERWSGGGYPSGLPARSQPPIVRAVTVADAFDAMTDPARAYRAPLGQEEALREVMACAGTHFEPAAARLLIESLSDGTPDQPSRVTAPRVTARPAVSKAPGLAAVH
jgi:putative nucleotidyltransferase with HDIG domain